MNFGSFQLNLISFEFYLVQSVKLIFEQPHFYLKHNRKGQYC